MPICKHCKWKWYDDTQSCPKCGKAYTEKRKSKRNNNTTLKNPKPLNRKYQINPVGAKKKRRDKDQVDAMRTFVKDKPKMCEHCGLSIKVWKYGNVDHIKTKGARGDLIADQNNFRILCDDIDVMFSDIVEEGEQSCHGLRHRSSKARFEAKKNKYKH